MPKLIQKRKSQPVARYLPWLEEDAELAQQVADVWNAIVEHGKADALECECFSCHGHRLLQSMAFTQGGDDDGDESEWATEEE